MCMHKTMSERPGVGVLHQMFWINYYKSQELFNMFNLKLVHCVHSNVSLVVFSRHGQIPVYLRTASGNGSLRPVPISKEHWRFIPPWKWQTTQHLSYKSWIFCVYAQPSFPYPNTSPHSSVPSSITLHLKPPWSSSRTTIPGSLTHWKKWYPSLFSSLKMTFFFAAKHSLFSSKRPLFHNKTLTFQSNMNPFFALK